MMQGCPQQSAHENRENLMFSRFDELAVLHASSCRACDVLDRINIDFSLRGVLVTPPKK